MSQAELHTLPGLPRDEAGPVFEEPWQAQAFALVLELHARGVFSWQAWTQALAAELRAHEDLDGTHYYHHWLSALEHLVGALGIADGEALAERKRAWQEAHRRTPHGQPVIAPDH
ncbi:MAG TPA: nitrile hydratase accessory protein [Polyangiales bacterium]|nr:nitrile hydratase accessory protein [Polyangiales bacterium]